MRILLNLLIALFPLLWGIKAYSDDLAPSLNEPNEVINPESLIQLEAQGKNTDENELPKTKEEEVKDQNSSGSNEVKAVTDNKAQLQQTQESKLQEEDKKDDQAKNSNIIGQDQTKFPDDPEGAPRNELKDTAKKDTQVDNSDIQQKNTENTDKIDNKNINQDNKLDEYKPSWSGSVMFDFNELKLIKDAVLRGQEKQSTTTTSSSAVMLVADNISPTFYLNSILYIADNDWSVWVNGKRYSSENKLLTKPSILNLEVVNLNKSKVTFEWRTRLLDQVSPNWKKILITNDEGDYTSEDGKVIVSKDIDSIKFELRPNQTFLVKDMQVVEGNKSENSALVR